MLINRHNYEEYFLLYTDGELSPSERQAVEAFAAANPDLAAELEWLGQSRLQPDEAVVFEGKDLLLKPVPGQQAGPDPASYQSTLLSYLDDELDGPQRSAFEQFLASDETARQLLDGFRQTKLQPDPALTFPDKDSLYRREPADRPAVVVRMRWWRMAVAAAVLVAAGLSVLYLLGRPAGHIQPAGPVASNQTPVRDTKPGSQPDTRPGRNTAQPQPPAGAENQKEAQPSLASATEPHPRRAIGSPEQASDKPSVTRTVTVNPGGDKAQQASRENLPAQSSLAQHDVPVRKQNPDPGQPAGNRMAENPVVNPVDQSANTANVAMLSHPVTENKGNPDVTNAKTQPYNNQETAAPGLASQTGAVFASNDDTKSRKVRGFFRKATRIFQHATNINPASDDDKVLIGVLAVKL
ncbi:MAG TPA: hypothetical protein VG870_12095 [Chitinophagaceae bacterium]|nr:hypothetical protein [Chitinophagaceae bacterium]